MIVGWKSYYSYQLFTDAYVAVVLLLKLRPVDLC